MSIRETTLFAGAALLIGSSNAFCTESSNKITCYGDSTLSSKNVQDITAYGSIQLNDCSVSGLLQSYGASTIISSDVASIYSAGYCSTQDSAIGSVQVFGYLTSENSNFTNTLEITSTSAKLLATQTKDIVFHTTTPIQPQALTLQQESTVNGDITFEEGDGTVYKSSDSTINGDVIGGKIIEKIKSLLRGVGIL